MKKRRIALLGCLAVLVAVWVSSAPAPPPPAAPADPPPAARAAGPTASSRTTKTAGSVASQRQSAKELEQLDLDEATARLRARIAQAPAPRSPERNPFDFERATPPASHQAVPVTRLVGGPPVPVGPPPPPQVTLSGIAETRTGEGVVRTAIIAGPGQLYFAKLGERVAGRYEVSAIGADIVELKDLNDATRRVRLALRENR
jgi:hypothetical protein